DGDPAVWDSLFTINVKTALNTCRAAIPHLRASRAGRIVNIGAYAALKAGAGMGAYTASKAGVHRLTESLAAELKDQRITVNAVLPSIIDTPPNRKEMAQADFSTWVSPCSLARKHRTLPGHCCRLRDAPEPPTHSWAARDIVTAKWVVATPFCWLSIR